MATRKITITLEEEQLEAVRELVASRQASSVSGFLQHAVKIALDDVAGWEAMLNGALERTGGPLTGDEIAWADGVLGGAGTSRRKRGKRAA